MIECYEQGVNACATRPVDFVELMKALKRPGAFPAAIHEPSPVAWKAEHEVHAAR